MSLEEALTANTAAIVALTKVMSGAKVTPAGKAAEALIEQTAAGKKPPTGTKPKATTIDTIKAKFGEFLGVEDKTLRSERKEMVRAMLQHFGVEKASDIDPSQWAEALGYVKQHEAGEQPSFMDEAGAGEEEEEALV